MDFSARPGAERRSETRYPIRTAAAVAVGDGRVMPARTLDIGLGGAGIVCDANLPVGTALALRVKLPARTAGSNLFEASATVVNCTLAGHDGGFRLGLQFGPLSAAAREALRGFQG